MMNLATVAALLLYFLCKYNPELLDNSSKPIDSAESDKKRQIEYDFIIVGAGSAGCVVASRLSENPAWKVLLIEAGGDETYLTNVPAFSGGVYFGTRFDWNYTTTKQLHVCQATEGYCAYPRGHVMGGTSIGGLTYSRGRPQDYNLWEEMGNPGWNYNSIFQYFLKAENMTIPELINSPYHATGGPLNISYSRYYQHYIDEIIQGGMEDLGLPKMDYNGQNLYGITYTQFMLSGATRCSTSKAYLEPIRNRDNLVIFKNTLVTEILFDNDGTVNRAVGVRCITNGEQYDVYASKEVILSAGAVNSPKLLMLSGIGPSQHLEQLGIPVLVDLPAVGSNLADHAGAALLFQLKDVISPYMNPQRTREALIEYARNSSGVFSAPQGLITLFLNSSGDTDVHVLGGSISTGVNGERVSGVGMYVANINTKSRGTVRLSSNNFADPPLLDPKYLSVDSDKQPIKYGLRQVFNLMNTSAMRQHSAEFIQEIVPDCNYTEPISDDFLDCLIYQNTYTGSHAVGTVRMGQPSDNNTAVDPSLRVHKVNGLRVVDASVMPTIPHGNTIAATVMIAEKTSEVIKSSY